MRANMHAVGRHRYIHFIAVWTLSCLFVCGRPVSLSMSCKVTWGAVPFTAVNTNMVIACVIMKTNRPTRHGHHVVHWFVCLVGSRQILNKTVSFRIYVWCLVSWFENGCWWIGTCHQVIEKWNMRLAASQPKFDGRWHWSSFVCKWITSIALLWWTGWLCGRCRCCGTDCGRWDWWIGRFWKYKRILLVVHWESVH